MVTISTHSSLGIHYFSENKFTTWLDIRSGLQENLASVRRPAERSHVSGLSHLNCVKTQDA